MRFSLFARTVLLAVILSSSLPWLSAATPAPGVAAIRSNDLQQWLTYIASDELKGRANFSDGLALAASYLADHLRSWGVTPAGDDGTYYQRVAVLGIKSTNRSIVKIDVNGRTRTFKNGEGVEFQKNVGGKRTFTVDGVERGDHPGIGSEAQGSISRR